MIDLTNCEIHKYLSLNLKKNYSKHNALNLSKIFENDKMFNYFIEAKCNPSKPIFWDKSVIGNISKFLTALIDAMI